RCSVPSLRFSICRAAVQGWTHAGFSLYEVCQHHRPSLLSSLLHKEETSSVNKQTKHLCRIISSILKWLEVDQDKIPKWGSTGKTEVIQLPCSQMIDDCRRKGPALDPESVTQSAMEGPPARNSQVLLISLLISVGCVFVLLCLLGLGQFPKQRDPNDVEGCTYNYECPEDSACINRVCEDPCFGICQDNATCQMFNHIPYCSCKPGFSGNPFTGCQRAVAVLAGDLLGNNSQPRRKRFEVERFIKVNWYAAYAHCRYHGGRLAVIESKEENEQVKEAILKTSKS
ncbi:hypothetical protein J6590_064125, partial [Homalodisca vitripennis]